MIGSSSLSEVYSDISPCCDVCQVSSSTNARGGGSVSTSGTTAPVVFFFFLDAGIYPIEKLASEFFTELLKKCKGEQLLIITQYKLTVTSYIGC
jgi:hypothetical protein